MRHLITLIETMLNESTKADVEKMIWYHGTNSIFDRFDPSRSADGHAQEGPGFYLTTDVHDATKYGKHIMQFRLKLKKLLPLTGRANPAEVEQVMRAAPDLNDSLQNWDEQPAEAFRMALKGMLTQLDPKSVFEQIWFDFYRDHAGAWLQQMVVLGYSGIFVPRQNDVSHFICFDPDALIRI